MQQPENQNQITQSNRALTAITVPNSACTQRCLDLVHMDQVHTMQELDPSNNRSHHISWIVNSTNLLQQNNPIINDLKNKLKADINIFGSSMMNPILRKIAL